MKFFSRALFTIALAYPAIAAAQLNVSMDYVGRSRMHDEDDNYFGRGGLTRVNFSYNQPLGYELNERKQLKYWGATLSVKYASLHNSPAAAQYHPTDIINGVVNVVHIRPVGEKWSLMCNAGAGIYAQPDDASFNCLLVNGGAFMIYKTKSKLDIGFGALLTNNFGFPALMPMVYFKWNRKGTVEIDLSMAGFKLKHRIVENFTSTWTLYEMDGLSAVMKVDDKWRIYSASMMRSAWQGEYKPTKKITLFVAIGDNWRRTSKLQERKIVNYYKQMFTHNNSMRFDQAFMSRVGVTIKFF